MADLSSVDLQQIIEGLWARIYETNDDFYKTLLIDAYTETGQFAYANCMAWCVKHKKYPNIEYTDDEYLCYGRSLWTRTDNPLYNDYYNSILPVNLYLNLSLSCCFAYDWWRGQSEELGTKTELSKVAWDALLLAWDKTYGSCEWPAPEPATKKTD